MKLSTQAQTVLSHLSRAQRSVLSLYHEVDPCGADVNADTALLKMLGEQLASMKRAVSDLKVSFMVREPRQVVAGSAEDLARL